MSLLFVTLTLPPLLFTKGNVTNICDHWAGKEDQLVKIDNSNWGAIGDPCWWSLTYFGGLEYVFLVLSAGNAWGTLDSNIPSVRDAHPTPPSLYQGECHKHL